MINNAKLIFFLFYTIVKSKKGSSFVNTISIKKTAISTKKTDIQTINYFKMILTIFSNLAAILLCVTNQSIEQKMQECGMVDISTVDSTIQVKLLYSTTNNFTNTDMYGDLEQAYMTPEIANMLYKAQQKLKSTHPNYSLIILDAARPMSIQQFMHDIVANTPQHIYVANPAKGGGRHNYGMAVDVTIVDKNGIMLDMGSGFDHFGELSHNGRELEFGNKGLMSKQASENRALLVETMKSVGFSQIKTEWWHFQKYSMDYLKENYKVID